MTGISSPIEWETAQAAIHAWLVDSCGVTFAWAEQPRRTQNSKPSGTVKLLSGPRVIHNDFTTKTWNAETELIDKVASGVREFTINAQVYTDSVTPNEHALNYMARAQSALKLPEFLRRFSDAGVAVVTQEGINNLTAIAGADWESRASMDVVFRVMSNVVAGSIPNIANTEHTLTLKNGNDGQPIIVPAP